MMDLTEFLLARIAEDEQQALDYFQDDGTVGTWTHWMGAECEAKRRIVDEHEVVDGRCCVCLYGIHDTEGLIWARHPCLTLRALALPYADHPEYREEWLP
jgi:hypothetical protein